MRVRSVYAFCLILTIRTAQIDSFERGSGYFFWTWTTTNENAADWDYKRLLELGVVPQNPDERMYPNICG